MVAYGCLFSDLRYNCNTFTQVAHTEILLNLRRSNDSEKEADNKQQAEACSSLSCTLLLVVVIHNNIAAFAKYKIMRKCAVFFAFDVI